MEKIKGLVKRNKEEIESMKKKTGKMLAGIVAVLAAAIGVIVYKAKH